eukprot:8985065-Ditylum_brightwellii.AAC.1
MEKTLESTTQLCSKPIKSEHREIPCQHWKKRLLPLHPRRLRGRVDLDMFFLATSMEELNGDMVNISAFRFSFWQ